MIRIAVCDDEKECLYSAYEIINSLAVPDIECFLFDSMNELILEYESGSVFDILVLDIEMDDMSGIEGAKRIMTGINDPVLFFMTSHTKYINEAFSVNAFQYLFKPLVADAFSKELEKAICLVRIGKTPYSIEVDHTSVWLHLNEVVYLELQRRVLEVVTTENRYIARGSIKEEFKKLKRCGFSMCNQGCIINLSHVRNIYGDAVLLDNGEKKYSSRRMHKNFISDYNLYMTRCFQ